MANENTLVVFEQENVQLTASQGTVALSENRVSHDKCIEYGRSLLDTIEGNGGLTDELDQQAAVFIERAKKTVKKMNDKRAPITKLFDAIRTSFTSMENDIDPSKKGSVPAQLQEYRNKYAAQKRAEQEAKRRQEMARIAKQQAAERYKTEVENDYRTKVNRLLIQFSNRLIGLDRDATLDNYETTLKTLGKVPTSINDDWFSSVTCSAHMPVELTPEESRNLQKSVLDALRPSLCELFTKEITTLRDDILMRMPSKKAELERIAQASAEEAARIKAQMEERERAEAAQRERERLERETQEKAAADMKKNQQEMSDLFGNAAAQVEQYQPKTQVKKRVEILSSEGFMSIVSLWWQMEGCNLSVDELTKIFSRQITFCNKLANDKENPVLITRNEHVKYVEDVKAK